MPDTKQKLPVPGYMKWQSKRFPVKHIFSNSRFICFNQKIFCKPHEQTKREYCNAQMIWFTFCVSSFHFSSFLPSRIFPTGSFCAPPVIPVLCSCFLTIWTLSVNLMKKYLLSFHGYFPDLPAIFRKLFLIF